MQETENRESALDRIRCGRTGGAQDTIEQLRQQVTELRRELRKVRERAAERSGRADDVEQLRRCLEKAREDKRRLQADFEAAADYMGDEAARAMGKRGPKPKAARAAEATAAAASAPKPKVAGALKRTPTSAFELGAG